MNVVLDCTYINDDHVDGRGTCGRKLVCYCEKSYTTTNYQPQYNGHEENKNKQKKTKNQKQKQKQKQENKKTKNKKQKIQT
jgi:hypothetical protein